MKSFSDTDSDTDTPSEHLLTPEPTTANQQQSLTYTEENHTHNTPDSKRQKITKDSQQEYSPTQTLNFTTLTPNTDTKANDYDTKHVTTDTATNTTTNTTTATSTTSTLQTIQYDGSTNERSSGATTHPSSLD